MQNKTIEEVEDKVEQFRTYVGQDGGHLELERMDENQNVYLRLSGSCLYCSRNKDVLYRGIQESLQKVDGVQNVIFL